MNSFYAISEHNLARVNEKRLAGCAYVVSIGGRVVSSGTVGYSDVENRVPLRADSIFRLASMTKPVTASAVMLQRDRGLISLDDPVSRFIPSFENMSVGRVENGKAVPDHASPRRILVRDLLTHTSGLASGPVGDAALSGYVPKSGETLADVIPNFGSLLLDFDPQSDQAYSGLFAFDTLARIVELTSGVSFPKFLRANIFDPLGLRDMTFDPTPEQASRVVNNYAADENGLTFVDMTGHIFGDLPMSYTSGGAGLLGTAGDYHKFASMLLDGGGILSREAVSLMRVQQQPEFPKYAESTERWGFGMRVITGENVLPVGCYGWSGAYGTHFWLDPSRDLAAVYMSNLTTAQGAGADTAREFERDVMNAL